MDMKDVVPPKWVLSTKRGWGMFITFVMTLLPMLNVWLTSKGIEISAPMVQLVGSGVAGVIDAVGILIGIALWVWGSFRPTAPLTVLPPKPVK